MESRLSHHSSILGCQSCYFLLLFLLLLLLRLAITVNLPTSCRLWTGGPFALPLVLSQTASKRWFARLDHNMSSIYFECIDACIFMWSLATHLQFYHNTHSVTLYLLWRYIFWAKFLLKCLHAQKLEMNESQTIIWESRVLRAVWTGSRSLIPLFTFTFQISFFHKDARTWTPLLLVALLGVQLWDLGGLGSIVFHLCAQLSGCRRLWPLCSSNFSERSNSHRASQSCLLLAQLQGKRSLTAQQNVGSTTKIWPLYNQALRITKSPELPPWKILLKSTGSPSILSIQIRGCSCITWTF